MINGRTVPMIAALIGLAAGFAASMLLRTEPELTLTVPEHRARTLADDSAAPAPARRASPATGSMTAQAALLDRAAVASLDELSAMLATTGSRLEPVQRFDELTILYRRYAELDPEAALAHAFSQGAGFASAWSSRWIQDIFHTWAINDRAAAVRAAQELETGRHQAGLAILSAVPPDHGETLSTLIDQLRLNKDIVNALPDRMLAIAHDPEAAFRTAPPSRSTWNQKIAAAEAWAIVAPRAAADAVAADIGDFRDVQALTGVIATWSRHDIDEAAAWVRNLPRPMRTPKTLAAALTGIASHDPVNAISIAADLTDSDERGAATSSVLARWAREDPGAAAGWLAGTSDPIIRDAGVAPIGITYARLDPSAAYGWAAALPPDEAARVLPRILSLLARESPERASRLVATIDNATARSNAASGVAAEWARQDPEGALDWSLEYPEESERPALVRRIFSTWVERDRPHAVQALDTLDEANLAAGAKGVLRGADAPTLEALYANVADRDFRASAARRLAIHFQDSDPDRARHYRQEAARLSATDQ